MRTRDYQKKETTGSKKNNSARNKVIVKEKKVVTPPIAQSESELESYSPDYAAEILKNLSTYMKILIVIIVFLDIMILLNMLLRRPHIGWEFVVKLWTT